jgi:hypothetical protein
LSTIQRVQLISTLISLSGENDWIDRWDGIATALDGLRNRRNDAVHSTWRATAVGHFGARAKAKGQVKIKYDLVPTEALENLSTEILALVDEIDNLTLKLLQSGAGKIINQFHPPGWTPPIQSQGPSQGPPAQTPNPKRARQQRRRKGRRPVDPKPSRAQRRAKALKAREKK